MSSMNILIFLSVYLLFTSVHQAGRNILSRKTEVNDFHEYEDELGEKVLNIWNEESHNRTYKVFSKNEYKEVEEVEEGEGQNYSASIKNTIVEKPFALYFLCNNEEAKVCFKECFFCTNEDMWLLSNVGKTAESSKHSNDIFVLKNMSPYQLYGNKSSFFLNKIDRKFANFLFLLREYSSIALIQNKMKKVKRDKTHIIAKEEIGRIISNKFKNTTMKEIRIKGSHIWNKETANDFLYMGKVKGIQNMARKRRILNDDYTVDCGDDGKCINEGGIQYCQCTKNGYSVNIKKNFKCEKHCDVNNGGCDINATCKPIAAEEEEASGVVKGVGVLCECKNRDTKYNGYYCRPNIK
ncbi:conserved Plasmodium protein, unknown function [Plasmodium malariae]|uniref:Uncharacterized protein n=1 Tax=Plasmodium malariae TaxID=5858 RepID=A0A1C3KFZ0_PLAMA|nr:conserved Plasmodium protein, unknown function [Plasmodium malariae]